MTYEFEVCTDCYLTGLGVADEPHEPTLAAMTELGGRTLMDSDSDLEPHFDWRDCELCHSPLGGHRFRVVITTI